MRAFQSQGDFNTFFPKSKLGFRFWTFFLSIFEKPKYFLEKVVVQNIYFANCFTFINSFYEHTYTMNVYKNFYNHIHLHSLDAILELFDVGFCRIYFLSFAKYITHWFYCDVLQSQIMFAYFTELFNIGKCRN